MQGADREAATIKGIVNMAQRAEKAGYDSLWMAHIRALDAISALTVAGTHTSRIELGPAVTPVYPRHPVALAQQTLTAAQACDGRFTLGIGVSHRIVVEGMLGMSYDKPARYMRDYLGALLPLLSGELTNYAGENFTLNQVQLDIPDIKPVNTIVAALGPVMLKLTGQLCAGTNTWMVGPQTINGHIAPLLNEAAQNAGRVLPRIVAGFPIVLTDDVKTTRQKLAAGLEIYGQLPSYRAMLDREGLAGPADLAIVGDEKVLSEALTDIAAAGVTDFNAAIMTSNQDEFDRTFDFLAAWRKGQA